MSDSRTWLLAPEQGTLDEPDLAVLVPFDFAKCLDTMRAMDKVAPSRDYSLPLPRARRLTARTWQTDVAPRAKWFPRTLTWPPGRVVELPSDAEPGERVRAEQALSAFWLRWSFGEEPTLAAPFNGARLATFLFGLAQTPQELVETVRYFEDFSTRFLRVVLTVPHDLSGDEKWARTVLDERWPRGLPPAVLTELLTSSDRTLREYAIQRLPEQVRSSRPGRRP